VRGYRPSHTGMHVALVDRFLMHRSTAWISTRSSEMLENRYCPCRLTRYMATYVYPSHHLQSHAGVDGPEIVICIHVGMGSEPLDKHRCMEESCQDRKTNEI
jgi:hypothetical protein